MLAQEKSCSSKGFTLIELLVVIAIIGLLSSVVLASLNTARERARDARRLSDIRQVQLALDLYASNNSNGYYPHVSSYVYYLEPVLVPNYMPALPEDPNRTGNSRYRYYAGSSTSMTYTILIDMEGDGSGHCKINQGTGYIPWQTYPNCF